jgi:8-oxo-dGTP pyrophosphatase MutT (NUDIX family)
MGKADKGLGAQPKHQVAALPFRTDPNGQVEFLLITSRETKRWVIPKGWPMRGKKPYRAAEREAYEEAGVAGEIEQAALGSYAYDKRMGNGSAVPCEVVVYPLRVKSQHKRWPEVNEREARWFTPDEAAQVVEEEGLRELLIRFGQATSAHLSAQQQRLKLRALWKPSPD